MANVILADRVKETTTTTGTGTLDLDGAFDASFQIFVDGAGDGAYVPYSIVGTSGASIGDWENGYGTVTDAATDTLSRTVVTSSSNAGALVDLAAGTKEVALGPHAHAVSGARGMDVIGVYDPSAASEVDIDITGYDSVQIVGVLKAGTDGADLHMRLSNDGGSTFRAGASDYAWFRNYATASSEGGDGDDADTQFKVRQGLGGDSGEQMSFEIGIQAPAESGFKTGFTSSGAGSRITPSSWSLYTNAGVLNTAEVNDAVRLLFSAGTMTGHVVAYGYKDETSPLSVTEQQRALDVIGVYNPSAVGELDIDITGYETVRIAGNLSPATDSAVLHLRMSNDGGSTFEAGASYYAWMRNYGLLASDGGDGDEADSEIHIAGGVGNDTGEHIGFDITVVCPGESGRKTTVHGNSFITQSDGSGALVVVAGTNLTAEVNDAIRLRFSAGNIASGHVVAYGYKNAVTSYPGGWQGALVTLTADETLVTGNGEILDWEAEIYDYGGWHDNSTNPSRLTVPAGVSRVKVSASVQFAAHATGQRRIYLRKDTAFWGGSGGFNELQPVANGTDVHFITGHSATMEVVAGNYFEIWAWQNRGGDLDVLSAYSWFAIEKVS